MTESNSGAQAAEAAQAKPKRRFGCLHVVAFVAVAVLLTALVTFFAVRAYVFPSPLRPVTLSEREEQALDGKLDLLGGGSAVEPEAYTEEGARHEVDFSEKELNALIGRNPDLAERLAIDLSDNLASAKLLIPLDDDFPILGGKTLRVTAGLEVSYAGGQPRVAIKGVSVMGVPLPNEWLGKLKNVNLVSEYGGDRGFWRHFAAGVESIEIRKGRVKIRLKE